MVILLATEADTDTDADVDADAISISTENDKMRWTFMFTQVAINRMMTRKPVLKTRCLVLPGRGIHLRISQVGDNSRHGAAQRP
jgi:hypothetical protein